MGRSPWGCRAPSSGNRGTLSLPPPPPPAVDAGCWACRTWTPLVPLPPARTSLRSSVKRCRCLSGTPVPDGRSPAVSFLPAG